MGLNLSTNLPMFVYTFQAMWRHRPLEEFLVFVGIRAAHTSFSPFTLDSRERVSLRIDVSEWFPVNFGKSQVLWCLHSCLIYMVAVLR